MKTLSVTSVVVAGPAVTINATWADQSFSVAHQQTSVSGFASANSGFARLFRVAGTAFFVARTGANTVAMLLNELAKVAVALEPGLSWAPRFTAQPGATTVAAGSDCTLATTVDATDELTPTYQWYRSTDGGATWTAITGATAPADGQTSYSGYATASLTIHGAALSMNGYAYKLTASNGAGSTNTATVPLTVTGAAPGITGNPSNASCIHNSTSATFSVTASGSSLSYQWQVSVDGSTGWTNLSNSTLGNPGPYSNVTTATVTVTPTTTGQNGYSYRCVVSNPSGNATSAAAVLTVT